MIAPRQDLSFAQLKIYYEEKKLALNERFTSSLELLTSENKYNYLAYLLADENGNSIKVAKYAGINKVDLIENEEYGYCSLIKATNAVLDKLKIENITRTKITSAQRIDKNLVDPVAMREAVINAIVHNDYSREFPPVFEIFSDRIVMTSYGGLMMGQSEDDFFSCSSMPRNRELMRVFRDVGLVEQLGSGMTRILQAYDKSVFEISDHFIRIILPFEQVDIICDTENVTDNVTDKLSVLEARVVEQLKENAQIKQGELAVQWNLSRRQIARAFQTLKDKGIIQRVGSDRTGSWEIL